MRVLLTSPRAPVTLDLARKLHRSGHDVYLCGSLRFGSAKFSRVVRRSYSSPGPRWAAVEYVDAINKIIRREKIELLLPTCEEIFYLAAWRDRIACDVLVDSFQTLANIHDKWTFSQSASNAFGSVPETFQLQTDDQVEMVRHRSEEFVFKPVYSRFASETLIEPAASKLDSIAVSTTRPWIAQRFVSGQEYSTYSVAKRGQLLAHCTYKSIFRAGIGSGICFQATPHAAITEFTKAFVHENSFTGQIGFDCIEDEQSNLWILEGNPRATSGLHLFDDSLIEALTGETNGLIEPVDNLNQMIRIAMIVFGLKDAFAKRNLNRYIREMVWGKDVLFRWTDPLPFLGLPLTLGELCWMAIRGPMSLQQASTDDIEWNGESIRNPLTKEQE